MKKIFLLILFCVACSKDNGNSTIDDNTDPTVEACADVTPTFSLILDASECDVDIQTTLGVSSVYTEEIVGNKRQITFNNIANHHVGRFPRAGNPNTISANSHSVEMTINPAAATSFKSAKGYDFGIFFSGVAIDPFTAEFFTNGGQVNRDWNETALTSSVNLGTDCNNAHVQPTGEYHYHGTPNAFIEKLTNGQTPTTMIKLGYAADGFPIYYKYGYDDSDNLVAMESGFRLKEGSRPGNGVSAPDGCYDGLYFQDYEYVAGVSPLDQANGKTGKTPEAASEYYYVVTDNFPSSPLYFRGTPDESFSHRP
ncbi:MAG: YHYH protein [Flavobacteriaceae bacterium]|nr:YHYH protein [Flavobacteriaceae bacterium]